MSAAAFEAAIGLVLSHEGAVVTDDPADRGGLTRWGFSLRWNPDLTREQLITKTRDQARDRYYSRWWLPNRWGSLPLRVAVKCFDAAATIGPADANRCLQRALRACEQAVLEDGACGSQTIAAARAADPPWRCWRRSSRRSPRTTASRWRAIRRSGASQRAGRRGRTPDGLSRASALPLAPLRPPALRRSPGSGSSGGRPLRPLPGHR